jgi:predicted RNase H-like HicB family nuclease
MAKRRAMKSGRSGKSPARRAVKVAVAAASAVTYSVVIHRADPDETGYWAEVPALPGCVTQGQTLDETMVNAREAILGHLEALVAAGEAVPLEDQPAVVPITVPIPVQT